MIATVASGADAGAGGPGSPGAHVFPARPQEGAPPPVAAPLPEYLAPVHEELGDRRREEADLIQYGQTLGLDLVQHEDLLWAVQEAFDAPLPCSWSEHTDDDGRVYFFNESNSQSTWEHPMDSVYRELFSIIQRAREADVTSSEEACAAVVSAHLREVHQRAIRGLEDWSGPYASEECDYYYNNRLKVSSWESPLLEWEQELMTRHSLLCRCLFGEGRLVAADGSVTDLSDRSEAGGSSPFNLLKALRLPLNLVRRGEGEEPPHTPSTSRSFHTARSICSTRSQRSYGLKDHSAAAYSTPEQTTRAPSPPAKSEDSEDDTLALTFGAGSPPMQRRMFEAFGDVSSASN